MKTHIDLLKQEAEEALRNGAPLWAIPGLHDENYGDAISDHVKGLLMREGHDAAKRAGWDAATNAGWYYCTRCKRYSNACLVVGLECGVCRAMHSHRLGSPVGFDMDIWPGESFLAQPASPKDTTEHHLAEDYAQKEEAS